MIKRILTTLGLTVLITPFLLHAQLQKRGTQNLHRGYRQPDGRVYRSMITVSNLSVWIDYDGRSAHIPSDDAGGFYPRGTAAVIFTDGPVWAGYVRDDNPQNPRMGGVTYNVGTTPGRILPSGVAQDPNDPEVRLYRIRKDYINLSNDELRREAGYLNEIWPDEVTTEQIQEVKNQYIQDWQNWPAHIGAPFYDLNGNGIYEPQLGETPGLAYADQVIWFVINDLNRAATIGLGGSDPIGLEAQVTLWAYDLIDHPLGQAVFRRYRLINKSGVQLDSMYFGLWADPDVGNYTDDLCGCDSSLDLAFVYSGYLTDAEFSAYGLYPSAIGYTLLQGPIIKDPHSTSLFDFKERTGCKNLRNLAFVYYGPGSPISDPPLGDYDNTLINYNLLRGYQGFVDIQNPTPFIIRSGPDKGTETKYPLSGDPFRGIGDVDGQGDNWPPGDRRMMLSTGPFTMMPGDTQEVIDARVGGLGTTLKYYSVEWLKENVRQIRSEFPYFDRVRRQPVAPVVKAVSSNRQIVLDWGNDPETVSRIEQDIPGVSYCFEGYRVWQLPSATAPGDSGMCIATFDKTSPPSVIIGKKYDPDHGLLIEVPLIKGTNSGIAHYITIEWDHLNDQSFIDGKDYFFGVTAYDYSDKPGNSYPVSESALSRITVTAEYSNPGYTAQSGDMLEVIHSGLSTGEVQALVVNPANVTGHTYEVVFDDQQNWSVIDMQTEEVKISDQTNLSGDGRYPVIDGILTIVTGPDSSDLKGWEYNGDRWITSVDWGGRFFYGGLDTGARFMGSTLTSDELVPVQLVFQDWTDVHAHGYTSRGAVYRRDLDYAYAGTGNLPITAYDVSDPEKPRRINICFVEDDNASAENGTKANLVWDMGWNSDSGQFAPMGGREYLYIMKSDYNEGADYDGNNIGTMSDVLFAIWPAARGLRIYLQSEFTIDLIIDRMNTPDDVFTFTAPPAPSVPNRFRVYQNYPNPFNQNTTFRFWIPQHTQVNLSVYDILGRRVATLVDAVMDRGEYFQHWETPDLASGLYIYRLQAGNQEKRGKMVLVK